MLTVFDLIINVLCNLD